MILVYLAQTIGFNFILMARENKNKSVINVPLQLLKDFKRDKSLSELLAFAIIIKMNHPDSRLGDLKIRTIATLLHCSPERAMKMLKSAKNNQQLFSYNKWTDSLTARDFKKPFIQQVNNHGHKAYQVYCVKYQIKEDISLNDILKQFKFDLIENAINAVERKDEFTRKSKSTTSFKPSDALTQRKLANIIGVKSKSTVCRKLKQLQAKGEIDKEIIHWEKKYIIQVPYVKILKQRKILGDKNYVMLLIPTEYKFTSASLNNKFQNIILNHSGRCTFHAKNKNMTVIEKFYNIIDEYEYKKN